MLALVARAQTPVSLFLNLASPDALFSTDTAEQKRLKQAGWKLNGAAAVWSEGAADRSALHRMVRDGRSGVERLFTGRAEEIESAKAAGFRDEGTIGFVALKQLRSDLVPVYRYRNGERSLWLIDQADRAWAEKAGWKLAGEDFWLLPAQK